MIIIGEILEQLLTEMYLQMDGLITLLHGVKLNKKEKIIFL